ncbi:MAG TPA: LysM peptidoglycan-binding domain-containing protein [Pseudogracilibacillus sp.]|nr:LysM peptidoglycan-binding domain-containing protein [Pseudogracilibacillus sp.]
MKKTVITVAASSVVMLGAMSPEASAEEYSVEKNDTIWGIANQYNTTAQKVMNVNGLSTDVIFPNQTLETGDDEESDDEEKDGTYAVKSGDTLSEIALDKGVSVEELKEWNNLSSSLIFAEDELQIKESVSDESEKTEEETEKQESEDNEAVKEEQEADKEADAKAEEEADAKTEEEAEAKAEEEAEAKAEEEAAEKEAEEAAEKEAEEAAEKEAEEQAEKEAEEQAAKEAEEQAAKEAEEAAAKEAEEQAEKEKQEAEQQSETKAPAQEQDAGESMTLEATAYTAECTGCSGITATGIDLMENPNQKVVAVDPDVIPLGSKVKVEGYGEAIAGDTGGDIQGDRIDVFVPSEDDALSFGRQSVKVEVLD